MKVKILGFLLLGLLLIPQSYGVVNPVSDLNFGTAGSGNGQLNLPESVAVDSSGNIYVVDTGNNRIQKFSSAGDYLSQFGGFGTGNGKLRSPSAITLDSAGNIYVADTGNNRIQKFSSAGVYVSQFGSSGGGNGRFLGPSALALDSTGNIYVADTGNNRIQKFSSAGVYVSQFGTLGSGNGQFRSPSALALDSAGNIYVADTNNHRIQKFSSAGVYVSQFGTLGNGNGQFSTPQGVSLDNYGNVLVSDTGNHRIEKFDTSGNFVLSFGSFGTDQGQLNFPQQIKMRQLQGFVADTNNNRIWVFHFPEYPVADDQRVSILEETALPITLTASDVNNDPLVFSVIGMPAHGTLTGTAPLLTYTPNVNYFGTDSFTFKANDGTSDSNVATIIIDVGNINDTPTSNAQSVTTNEDTQKAITVTATDPDDDTLQYIMVNNVQYGSISGTLPNVVYTPNLNYYGSDSFSFKVNDGLTDSNTSVVTITVNSVNDPPVAYDVNATLNEDTPILTSSIPYQQSDVEDDPLSLIIITPLSHGTLSGVLPDLIYTPDPNYYGTDCLTFKVNDGEFESNVATGCAIILPINDPPVTNSTLVQTDEDTPLDITLEGTDIEDDPLTFQVTSQPSHGEISGTLPDLVYTPDQNYNGADSFQYNANDGNDDSIISAVSITVNPVNDPPVAYSMNFTTPEDTPFVNTHIVASDVEGDTLTYNLVTPQSHGILSGIPPFMTYAPDLNYVGPDSLAFSVNDGELDSNVATIFMEVGPIEDQPETFPQSVSTDEDVPLDIELEASDPDGDPLTYQIVALPSHGIISGDLPNIRYTPAQNYYGSESLSYKVNDGLVDSNTSVISITINSVNDPPVAYDLDISMYEDTPYTTLGQILQGSYDVEGDPLTYELLTFPTNGMLSGVWPDIHYDPNPNFYGSECITFQVNDGEFDSNIGTACGIINPVNDAPVGDDQQITTEANTLTSITLTASDIENDELSFSVISPPAHGLLFGAEPSLNYLPNRNYVGADQFTFKANDGNSTSLPATISINVSQAAQTTQGGSESGKFYTESIPRVSEFGIFVDDSPENSLSYDFTKQEPMTLTLDAATDEKIRFQVKLDDVEAGTKIIHFGLYTNIRKTSSDVSNSNAYMVFDVGSPVQVVDGEGIFKDSQMNVSYKDGSMIVDGTLTFEKPMERSDIILEVWNQGRHPVYKTIPDIISVGGSELGPNTSGFVTMPAKKSTDPIKVFSTAEGKVTEINHNGILVVENKDVGINISGFVKEALRGEKVQITILRPDDAVYTTSALVNEDKSYTIPTKLHTKWAEGFYEILVTFKDKDQGKIRFFVTDQESAGGEYGAINNEPEKISQISKYLGGDIPKEEFVSYLSEIGWSEDRIDNFLENNSPAYYNPYAIYYLGALLPLLFIIVSILSREKKRQVKQSSE